MAPAVLTVEQIKIINTNPANPVRIIDSVRNDLPGIGAMDHLKALLSMLSYSKPARLITLADSLDNLATELRQFVNVWEEQETLPETLRPQLSLLLEKLASRATELDIWIAVVMLLKEFSRLVTVPTKDSTSTTTISINSTIVESLKRDWTSIFIPDSLRVLEGIIRDFDNQTEAKRNEFYLRTLISINRKPLYRTVPTSILVQDT
ncbi:hypothetical protein V8E54_013158 [Elaphomyces granulatus]